MKGGLIGSTEHDAHAFFGQAVMGIMGLVNTLNTFVVKINHVVAF